MTGHVSCFFVTEGDGGRGIALLHCWLKYMPAAMKAQLPALCPDFISSHMPSTSGLPSAGHKTLSSGLRQGAQAWLNFPNGSLKQLLKLYA